MENSQFWGQASFWKYCKLLSKDLCFLPYISLYHFLTLPLLFIAFMLPPETLVSLVHKITNLRKRGSKGLLCDMGLTVFNFHEIIK